MARQEVSGEIRTLFKLKSGKKINGNRWSFPNMNPVYSGNRGGERRRAFGGPGRVIVLKLGEAGDAISFLFSTVSGILRNCRASP